MANEKPTEQPVTSADVVNDSSARKLREAESTAAKLEKQLQELQAEKNTQDRIIQALSQIPSGAKQVEPTAKKKSLLDELCDFLGIEV